MKSTKMVRWSNYQTRKVLLVLFEVNKGAKGVLPEFRKVLFEVVLFEVVFWCWRSFFITCSGHFLAILRFCYFRVSKTILDNQGKSKTVRQTTLSNFDKIKRPNGVNFEIACKPKTQSRFIWRQMSSLPVITWIFFHFVNFIKNQLLYHIGPF